MLIAKEKLLADKDKLLTEKEKQIRELEEALAIMEKCLGSQHPYTKKCKENLEIAEQEAQTAEAKRK